MKVQLIVPAGKSSDDLGIKMDDLWKQNETETKLVGSHELPRYQTVGATLTYIVSSSVSRDGRIGFVSSLQVALLRFPC